MEFVLEQRALDAARAVAAVRDVACEHSHVLRSAGAGCAGVVGDADAITSLRARLDALEDVFDSTLPVQALHGDASLSNLPRTPNRLIWNDFEDTFRGPVHWDLAGYVMALRARGATPDFVRRVLDHYGWGDEPALDPFIAAHAVYNEIWRLYDRQRRSAVV